ncbi:hypothetical protein Tco_0002669 [Tanacetum coccineum]
MVISSPCLTNIKNWLVQKQMAFGKDFSNPFTADNLLKTIWFSTHHASYAPCYSNEALAIPEQTATSKEISNPFMASSLPKTSSQLSLESIAVLLKRLEKLIKVGIKSERVKITSSWCSRSSR